MKNKFLTIIGRSPLNTHATALLSILATCVTGFLPLRSHGAPPPEVVVIDESIIAIHLTDGSANYGSVGTMRAELIKEPLDLTKAASPANWSVSSADDDRYRAGQMPVAVGRKSKGRDFITTGPGRYDHLDEHWLYLTLKVPMREGASYSLKAEGVLEAPLARTFRFGAATMRSEAVHVNQIGFVPSAEKFGYLSAWLGDLGPWKFAPTEKTRFHLVNKTNGATAFSGTPKLRKAADGAPDSMPASKGTFARADVWECDFSAVREPGEYVLMVDGVGCSFPFRIGEDVYRQPFITTARALYHQRSGIALKSPFTERTRAEAHRGAKMQTTHRYLDGAYSDGFRDAAELATGELREVWGGWHDAGDWDQEGWHFEAANLLLLAVELAPDKFRDGDLNIPESGNGIPDLVDEAMWAVDFWKRLQRADGGVSVGTFADSFPHEGEYSVTDTLHWFLYAEDPQASLRYAALAARLAHVLRLVNKANLASNYVESARKAWTWAAGNLREGDEARIRDDRAHAAASLFRVTGEAAFLTDFQKDNAIQSDKIPLTEWKKHDQRWAAWTIALTDRNELPGDLRKTILAAVLRWADTESIAEVEKRAFRTAGNMFVPQMMGGATVPEITALAMAHKLTGEAKYLHAIATTCDYTLGGNPLNMTWVTGLGDRSPDNLFHPDAWHSAPGTPIPGFVLLGPYQYEGPPDKNSGPWDPKYLHTSTYPDAKLWPPHELWMDSRSCPSMNEFTVGTIAHTALAFSALTH
ncbi:MAG: glycoside hydrolase family 9 protein [Chthoniobacteraceae bacterium]